MLATRVYQPRALGSKYNEARMEKKLEKGEENRKAISAQGAKLAQLSNLPAYSRAQPSLAQLATRPSSRLRSPAACMHSPASCRPRLSSHR